MQSNTQPTPLIIVATVGLILLAGCDNHSSNKTGGKDDQPNLADLMKPGGQPSQSGGAAPATPASAPSSLPASASGPSASPSVPEPAAPLSTPLPTADKATPDAAYVTLNSGNPLMFAYLAMLGAPIDYPKELRYYSRDYAYTSDEFKKHDLEAALKPKLDAEIARAKSNRYFRLPVNEGIGQYDFAAGGFPLPRSISDADLHQSFSDNGEYGIAFSNSEAFHLLKPASEGDARMIEGIRSKGASLHLIVFCFLQDADPTNKTVKAQIVKVELVDGRGSVLATQE